MDDLKFLSVFDIVALHEDAMSMTADPPAALVRSELLESATAHARNVAYYESASPAEIAAHLTVHLAMAHPWVDGNKRTAVYAGLQQASLNGARDPNPGEMIAFADALLAYISQPDRREDAFANMVEIVEGWFN